LAAITTVDPAADVLPIVDISDTSMAASGTTKKITSNQILGAGGTATLASATITGDLTVDTNVLKVDTANNRVGIRNASPTQILSINGDTFVSSPFNGIALGDNAAERLRIGYKDGTPDTGLVPAQIVTQASVLQIATRDIANGAITLHTGTGVAERFRIAGDGVATWSNVGGVAGTAMTLNSTGLGVGVTPSAWGNYKVLEVGTTSSLYNDGGVATDLSNNMYINSSFAYIRKIAAAATRYEQNAGAHAWYNAASSTAGSTITFTQAMTLDASGNLLVGLTSGSYNRIKKDSTADAGNAIFELVGASNATSSIHYSVSSYNANAANAASKFGRDGVTLRSINAGGTVNASGADYAEYMVKCSDFVLAKGDVAGIDANGKLTNVFADAVSFVVKSTDPSYVGNDKWGVDLEGDALEAARQLVDRIAFAGQVPVNVTGAKAGDYIVPVANGTGIKGQAVSNPTFEQYQLTVGKVIGIDADGRARIIVKVA
jgi:hypothetical protein